MLIDTNTDKTDYFNLSLSGICFGSLESVYNLCIITWTALLTAKKSYFNQSEIHKKFQLFWDLICNYYIGGVRNTLNSKSDKSRFVFVDHIVTMT